MSKIVMNQLTHPQRVRLLYKTILRLHRGEMSTSFPKNINNFTRFLCIPQDFRRNCELWAITMCGTSSGGTLNAIPWRHNSS